MFTLSLGGGCVSRYFSLSPKASPGAVSHSALLSNYGLIRDVGRQALVRERKTPRNQAEHLDL